MNNIQKDKLLHFFWSSILLVPLTIFLGQTWGYLMLMLVGACKEMVYDKVMGRGNPEMKDFIFGCLPIIIHFISTL